MTVIKKLWAVIGLALGTAVVGWVDIVTGPEYGLSLFYLLPVAVSGRFYGKRLALFIAVEAATWWLYADISTRTVTSLTASVWNGTTRLATFSIIGVGIATLKQERDRLRSQAAREQALARTDALTGLANRRAFRERLGSDLARASRHEVSVCVVFFDIDNFKQVNDRYGHDAGDHLLADIARTIKSAVREGDVAARLGGDEFVAALWGADSAAGACVAQRVVDAVRQLGEKFPDAKLGASAGVADSRLVSPRIDDLLREADRALYRAKSAGKGTVQLAAPTLPEPNDGCAQTNKTSG